MNQPDRPELKLTLDTDLRLHPQRIDLGRAELLTDAITLPFEDIESRLNQYFVHSSQTDQQKLRSSMKGYLGRLNANPLIPINFRLKVLNRFEKELNLFDGEITSAVLNAHKIGIDLVQKEAREDSQYYGPLVEMVANAIELAAKILQLTVKDYKTTLVIVTRHFFDLARLGLNVAAALDPFSTTTRQRLVSAICRHELLRALDLFSKTSDQQLMIINELEHHLSLLDAQFYSREKPVTEFSGRSCLVSNMNRPNDPPQLIEQFENNLAYDAIVIPVDKLIREVSEAVEVVEAATKEHEKQGSELYTEDTILTTLVGGSAILNRLSPSQHRDPRIPCSKTHLHIEWDSRKAFSRTSGSTATPDPRHAWRVVDISQGGACIERLHEDVDSTGVGSIVELTWSSGDHPSLALVRWTKQIKTGETRLGLMFLRHAFKRLHGYAKTGGSDDMGVIRKWPLLIIPDNQQLFAYFPEATIFPDMLFIISGREEDIHFKVLEVDERGPNFCRCRIVRAHAK